MRICENCFSDENIKGMIQSEGNIGECDICGARNCFIYDTEKADRLVPYFDEIFSAYSPSSELNADFPENKKAPLAEKMKKDWNLFSPNRTISDIAKIIKALNPDAYDNHRALFVEKVGVAAFQNKTFLTEHSILRGSTWEAFVHRIKFVNRFHVCDFNEERLEYYCRLLSEIYKKDTLFYRARIKKDNKMVPYDKDHMGAPPSPMATNGRINPRGISCLYLCEDPDTPLYEVRAQHHDYVSVAEFRLINNIVVANLRKIDKINPVILDLNESIASDYLINKSLLEKISQAMTRPQRSSDSELEYLPTQYIADFIKSLVNDDSKEERFRGIAFASAANPGHNNFASFYPEDFEINDDVRFYEISQLTYKYDELHQHF